MSRRLGNWLDSFLEWTLPRSESPRSMLKWTGLFTLASVTKRKIRWPEKLMGGYEIFPNLYIVFVGKPAVVRKSTTMGYAERLLSMDLLAEVEDMTFASDITSHSKLLNALSESSDGSITILSSEFSSLVQTTPEAMYELLTDIFDNKPKQDWSTWEHGDHSIKSPVVNLIAATTPAWISKQPPEYFVGGGFASRILFLYEENPRQREIYYDHLDFREFEKLKMDLTKDLRLISQMRGEFSHDSEDTKEHIREWYLRQDIESPDERLEGYYGRKHVHAHKVAGLLSLAERGDMKITREHWDEAVELLEYIEKKMGRAFSTLGVNPFTVLMEDMLEYIAYHQCRSLQDIAGRFYTAGMTLEQLRSALAFLEAGGKIKSKGIKEPKFYIEEAYDAS